MDNICDIFWKNADPVALYDIVLLMRNLGEGLTPGEVATMAGKMDGPFEPIEFQGEKLVAMGFGTVEVVNRLLLNDDIEDLEGLEGLIVSILDEKESEGTTKHRPGGRYTFTMSSGETIKILLCTNILCLASSVSAVFRLSTLHLKPQSYENLIQMSQVEDAPLIVLTSHHGTPGVNGKLIVGVPDEIEDLLSLETYANWADLLTNGLTEVAEAFASIGNDLGDCLLDAGKARATWIEFSLVGRRDPSLPTYWEEWSGENM